jgi:hypothetical protein
VKEDDSSTQIGAKKSVKNKIGATLKEKKATTLSVKPPILSVLPMHHAKARAREERSAPEAFRLVN